MLEYVSFTKDYINYVIQDLKKQQIISVTNLVRVIYHFRVVINYVESATVCDPFY